MAGLTDTGYLARTGGEWYAIVQTEVERICTDLGVSPPRWTRAEFVTAVARVMSQLLAELDGAVEAQFDMYDPTQIAGALLQDYARLAGVPYVEATNSSVVLTVGAWAIGSVSLSAGTQASDGTNTWELSEDVTIAASGTATVSATCTTPGSVTASAGTITRRVTSVAGWTSVTNAADAIPGVAASTDAFIRAQIGGGNGSYGSRSPLALRTALMAVGGVTDVQVYHNPTLGNVTVNTRVVPGNGMAIWVHPSTISDAAKAQILGRMYALADASVARSKPTVTGADGVLGTVLGADGQQHEEGYWWFTSSPVYVRVILSDTTSYEPGYSRGSIDEAVQAAVEAFWGALQRTPGGSVFIRQQDLIAACVAVPGCARVDLRLGTSATPSATADLEIGAGNYPSLTFTVEHSA